MVNDNKAKVARERLQAMVAKKKIEELKKVMEQAMKQAMELKKKLILQMIETLEVMEKKNEVLEELMEQEKAKGKRIDGILTADEHHVWHTEEPLSLDAMTLKARETDPGFTPVACGTINKYGRYEMIPWAEGLKREANGTLKTKTSFTKSGDKSFMKQIASGRVKMQFTCEYCHTGARGVEPLKQCGDCMVAAYCSKECQAIHWKKHKRVCRIMKKEGRGLLY
ncbi:hypothetical protein FRACYDRAFT_251322 [Fragilariopsis cylindrus CCMP1102]|uniref:MYND-type domain-containing protein n=1 Tax=Fragilariopsis cylindrus CCMP1102 TaxID=635003 RepID=A0A1E7EMS3_9STRA|nr:hypothetical protein FRACYDRAFT_251322 [Fragilariopsis cylindrus CCMP1102]|eukprot:OEU07249.1 hypothetical protein FRACYDRAFT_251322 [Fragilariopsis cylindrus CCMP1102]